MSTRKLDIAWEHCTQEGEGKKRRVKCNYCSKLVGGINRLKQHLARVGTDVTGCPNVPIQVSHEMLQSLVQIFQQTTAHTSIDRGQSTDEQTNVVEGGQQVSAVPKLKIAYKGVTGACSEEAVLAVYPHCQLDPCETFETALQAVECRVADKVIIPIENSLGGSFHENYNLINSHHLHIVGEFEVSMNFCLLARLGVKLEQLKRVLGHPQALAQTKTCLGKLGVEKDIIYDDPYYAQLIISYKQESTGLVIGTAQEHNGVIGSAKAVDSYNLHVVASGIQDEDKGSITRFWILARDPVVLRNERSFKTCLVFTLPKSPKDVHKALSIFAREGIRLTKVVSTPQRNILENVVDSSSEETVESFDYLFYVDLEASESGVEHAVRQLKDYATSVRILGCYPGIAVGGGTP